MAPKAGTHSKDNLTSRYPLAGVYLARIGAFRVFIRDDSSGKADLFSDGSSNLYTDIDWQEIDLNFRSRSPNHGRYRSNFTRGGRKNRGWKDGPILF